MEKMDGKTLDLAKENINTLKKLFPEVVTEGKIDFEKLKLVLGEEVDVRKEKYEFTWHAKSQSMKLAQIPSAGTLRPDVASSKNWDSTENLYIEGDNLEVLKLLQKSYFGKVKMIYIDPPYNTGKDFVYKDDFQNSITKYKELTEQTMKSNPETSGRYHTDWLNMIYPRLKLARNLLREDGVIFLSIDDNELYNLKKICDEIFGETNYIATLPTVMNLKGNNDQYGFSGTHEYTIVYTKNRELVEFGYLPVNEKDLNDWEQDEYGYFKKGANLKSTGVNAPREKRPNLFFPLYIDKSLNVNVERKNKDDYEIYPITNGREMSWRWSKEKFINEPHNIIVTQNNGEFSIYKKTRPIDGEKPSQKPKSLFYKPEYSSGNGTNQIRDLFGEKVFSNPKPLELLMDFIRVGYGADKDGILLDFYAGSSTSAHALMKINAEDGGKRKFIMVQLPELLDENDADQRISIDFLKQINKDKNLSEISMERIRRAGSKIYEDTGKLDLDVGFKVFKLDTSNLKTWDPDTENLEQDLFDLQDNIKDGRSKEDLLYEILLKVGIPLTTPIEEVKLGDKVVYSVGFGGVLLCLEDEIDLDTVHAMIKLKPEDFETKVIFKETGFLNDSVKANAIQTLKKNGITDVRSV
ncbi:site-specific DNA-methyltransferase [Oceanobacillus caeni]|uniref:site-specific DNA-methyltransferase n=1 Tax=Oceanobacillus caeni TaxID=405946 RepID=UPI00363AFA31